jgi:hypothetical protein
MVFNDQIHPIKPTFIGLMSELLVKVCWAKSKGQSPGSFRGVVPGKTTPRDLYQARAIAKPP